MACMYLYIHIYIYICTYGYVFTHAPTQVKFETKYRTLYTKTKMCFILLPATYFALQCGEGMAVLPWHVFSAFYIVFSDRCKSTIQWEAFLCFHGNNIYVNSPQCYVIRTSFNFVLGYKVQRLLRAIYVNVRCMRCVYTSLINIQKLCVVLTECV
jgi:hypothetical protein